MEPKAPTEMTDDELYAQWEAGMYFDVTVGLTDEQEAHHAAIEAEMKRREVASGL